ncbi:hypothetical protein [Nocardia asiatica]|uniref:hypothetical protein n=1 Tax=Nocardia asiatica TaxID=209252 RepID=UPI0006866353|nr:hypothetical protein [Nocardia asiatica]
MRAIPCRAEVVTVAAPVDHRAEVVQLAAHRAHTGAESGPVVERIGPDDAGLPVRLLRVLQRVVVCLGVGAFQVVDTDPVQIDFAGEIRVARVHQGVRLGHPIQHQLDVLVAGHGQPGERFARGRAHLLGQSRRADQFRGVPVGSTVGFQHDGIGDRVVARGRTQSVSAAVQPDDARVGLAGEPDVHAEPSEHVGRPFALIAAVQCARCPVQQRARVLGDRQRVRLLGPASRRIGRRVRRGRFGGFPQYDAGFVEPYPDPGGWPITGAGGAIRQVPLDDVRDLAEQPGLVRGSPRVLRGQFREQQHVAGAVPDVDALGPFPEQVEDFLPTRRDLVVGQVVDVLQPPERAIPVRLDARHLAPGGRLRPL